MGTQHEGDAGTRGRGDAESEACETQVWVEFAQKCGYLKEETARGLDEMYDQIIG